MIFTALYSPDMHGAVFAALIARGQLRRNLFRNVERRTFADAEIFLDDMIAPVAEKLLGLAADDDKISFFLVRNMPHRFLEYVRGIGSGQSLVCSDNQEKLLFRRLIGLEKRMLEIGDIGRDVFHDLSHLVRVRLVRHSRHLGAPQACRRDHLHRLGDLLDALYAAYSAAYIL